MFGLCDRWERVHLASRHGRPARGPRRPRGRLRQLRRVEPRQRTHVRIVFRRQDDPHMGGTAPGRASPLGYGARCGRAARNGARDGEREGQGQGQMGPERSWSKQQRLVVDVRSGSRRRPRERAWVRAGVHDGVVLIVRRASGAWYTMLRCSLCPARSRTCSHLIVLVLCYPVDGRADFVDTPRPCRSAPVHSPSLHSIHVHVRRSRILHPTWLTATTTP